MASTAELGAAFVKVTLQGIERAKKDLASVKSALFGIGKGVAAKISVPNLPPMPEFGTEALTNFGQKASAVFGAMSAQIAKVGSVATAGFGVATGAITALVRQADPLGFQVFTLAIQSVSIQLGRIFVPLLHDVTSLLVRLDNFLRNMTDTQRANIARWIETGLVVLGSAMAFAKLFSVITTGFTILSGFVAVLGALGIATPVGWVIALTAAIVGLLAVVGGASGGFSGLFASIKPALDAILAAFQSCFAAIQPIITVAMDFVVGGIRKALDLIVPFISKFAGIIANAWGQISAIVTPILTDLFTTFNNAWDSLKPALDGLLNQILEITQVWATEVVALWREYAPIVGDVIQALIPILTSFYNGLIQVVTFLLSVVPPVIRFFADMVKMAADGFITNVNAMISVMNQFITWFNNSIFARATGQIGLIPQLQTGPRPSSSSAASNNPQAQGNSGRFQGQVIPQAPQLLGIAEAWRKAQTSTTVDPATAQRKLQLEQTEKSNDLLQQLVTLTNNNSNSGGTFGA